MKLKIKKNYHRDTYHFYTYINKGVRDLILHFLFKEYKALLSDDFKRIILIDEIIIDGIMNDKPKKLKYLTINKYDVREVEREYLGK
jgi:hypothetical protein